MSIYEQIGGQETIEKIVDLFYVKVLSDERINKFFTDVDINQQKIKQTAFLTMIMGGQSNYSGKDMGQAHAHLFAKGLTPEHMSALVENLQSTLVEMNLPPQAIQQFVTKFDSMRKMVFSAQN
jgi:hemoglobin